jgi:MFS family permease
MQGDRERRKASTSWVLLLIVGVNHLVADGAFAVIYPLLPAIRAELSLSYAQASLFRAAFKLAGAALQFPAGVLAESVGQGVLLLAGNIWLTVGVAVLSLAGTFSMLLVAAVAAGLGGNTQHPVGTSLVSRLYEHAGRGRAIGVLNFSGDLGKLAAPALAGLVAATWGWRTGLMTTGVVGLVLVAAAGWWGFMLRSDLQKTGASMDTKEAPQAKEERAAFSCSGGSGNAAPGLASLTLIGILDSSFRGAALTLLSFVLASRGMSTAVISGLYTLVFAGGAAGKFLCGWMADRWGTVATIFITETSTAVLALSFLVAGDWALVPLALTFGFALNGTSTVLYSSLAPLVSPERRSRMYGMYYTVTIGASALAPVLYGALGDRFGLLPAFVAAVLVTLLILPLAWRSRKELVA